MAWITDEPPDRARGGGNIRQAHLLSSLAGVADVTLIVFGRLGDDPVLREVTEVVAMPAVRLPEPSWRPLRRLHDLWLALGARGTREVAVTARKRRRLRPIVRDLDGKVDAVVACHPHMAVLLPRRRSYRWITDLHHIPSAKAVQEQTVAAGRRQRWLYARQAAKARRMERRLLRDSDVVLTVSEEDAMSVAGHRGDGRRLVVVPNGVDTRRYTPTPVGRAPRIVMTGSFQYWPNIDGAVWLCEEVLPLVLERAPEVTVDLVGREPHEKVRALTGHPQVELHADVPSVVPWLDRARVAVVPLRVGSGTRLKALEAMAAGRPVVGTTVGLEGLGVVDGVHALVADTARAFADAIVRVLDDEALVASLTTAGRALAEDFEWGAIGERFTAAVLGDRA